MPLRLERITQWRLRGTPEAGDEVIVNERRYTIANVGEYTTSYGNIAPLVTFDATCTVCGKWFQFESGLGRFKAMATCDAHRGQWRKKRR